MVNAQIVTLEPSNANGDQEIKVIFDATQRGWVPSAMIAGGPCYLFTHYFVVYTFSSMESCRVTAILQYVIDTINDN